MVIHGESREGGVLPVIASERGRRGGGPEVTGGFHKGQRELEKGTKRQEEWHRGMTWDVWRIGRQNEMIWGTSEG